MIAGAFGYFKASVDLLKQHYSEELMRKGHSRKGQLYIGKGLYAFVKPEGASYYKYKLSPAAIYIRSKLFAEFLA